MNRRQALIAALTGVAGIALWQGRDWLIQPQDNPFWRLQLVDLEGQPQPMAQWRDRLLLANFWATWCEPCRDEIPALMQMQQKFVGKSLQVVGIGIDAPSKMRDFRQKLKIPYPLLTGGMESLAFMRELGNTAGVLPFTAVFRPGGELAYTHVGALTETEIAQLVTKLEG